MSDHSDTDDVHVLNTTALVGFFLSGAIGAVALFALPLAVDTSGPLTFGQFRRTFILICLVEGAAAVGVLFFGMRLYQPGPDAETATDGGHGD